MDNVGNTLGIFILWPIITVFIGIGFTAMIFIIGVRVIKALDIYIKKNEGK